jgi:hypothetical protein
MTARDDVLLDSRDPGITGLAFHQHFFQFTPLLIQAFLFGPVGIIRECNLVGKRMLDSQTYQGREEHSGRSGDIGVQAETWPPREPSLWLASMEPVLSDPGHFDLHLFQEKLNKVKVGRPSRV